MLVHLLLQLLLMLLSHVYRTMTPDLHLGGHVRDGLRAGPKVPLYLLLLRVWLLSLIRHSRLVCSSICLLITLDISTIGTD